MKYLAALIFALTASVSFASLVDATGLTDEQVNELKIKALQMKNDKGTVAKSVGTATAISAATRTEAEQWASFGKNLGTAMVSTAKELGVAVNEFSQTGVGQVTTAMPGVNKCPF